MPILIRDHRGLIAPEEIRVIGPLPSSIVYLHSLVMKGMWTSKRVEEGSYTIFICYGDKAVEPSLSKADYVTLQYAVK